MRKPIALIGLLLLSTLLPLKALAVTFSRMYVFGDSLSDPGNLFNLTGGQIPPSPYFNGRFSNGPTWVEYLAQDLNLNPTPYTALTPASSPTQGINFAIAGATTGTDNTIAPVLPGLRQQIGSFANLLSANQPADPNALYVLWGGANDYLPTQSTTFTPFTTPNTSISNLSFALNSLVTLGARNFLIANLPNLGSLPLTRTTQDSGRLNTLTSQHNTSLATTLNTLDNTTASNLNIRLVDVNSLFNNAISNPSQYGFTNITDACINNLNCVAGGRSVQDQYLFWDDKHPSTATHKHIEELAYRQLQSEPEPVPEPASVMGTIVFGALATRWKLKHKSKKVSLVKGSKTVD
ncbi:MAG TPA: SGNH/GDSL hydrolase family protein [Waterburya sp.]